MSHADKARKAMTDAVFQAYAPVMNAGRILAVAMRDMQNDDLEKSMRAVVEVIIAGEQLTKNVEAFTESGREALASCIDDTGCPEVVTMHHKATVARKPAFVAFEGEFVSEDDRFWNAPTPNKRAIKEVLEAGDVVPGCELRRPNSMTLKITARK